MDGINGTDGKDGVDGINGTDGKDAYQIYKDYYEYEGSYKDWIDDLINGTLVEKIAYTVTFDTNGGSEIPSQKVKNGQKALEPNPPTKEGCIFKGWYVNEERWSFIGYSVTGDITLTAKWEEFTQISLQYDDRYKLSSKNIEILDQGTPTSYKVGFGVATKTLDDCVITIENDYLIATGIGEAYIYINNLLHKFCVEPAPISLILLAGQSNMQGSEGNADQSIICPDGMVYATYGDRYNMTIDNATSYVASALTGDYKSINVNGTSECLSDYPINFLNESGAGKAGPDSGFAYEWVKQTGEKIWIVNAAHGGSSINTWQKNGENYKEAIALFSACQETLKKEISAGHYSLSHMGYFWCQGCTDATQTSEWYIKKYLTMHENFKLDLAFDDDHNNSTPERSMEFAGIIPIRSGSNGSGSYRAGTYEVSPSAPYYESFLDIRMNGPRVAQYWMGNNPELEDIFVVCTIQENWVTMPDGTDGVADYFTSHYPNGKVDYTPQTTQSASWYTPKTPASVHDSIHYNQIGYNEIGKESVRNLLYLLGILEPEEVETTVKFVAWDGFTEVEKIFANPTGDCNTLAVPIVTPIWKAKTVTYTPSENIEYKYYDILAPYSTVGSLTAVGAKRTLAIQSHQWTEWQTIRIPSSESLGVKQRVCLLCNTVEEVEVEGVWQKYDLQAHLSDLPDNICSNINLWTIFEHDPYYFISGAKWGIHSSGTVYSITIPVQAGDKIYATSFGKSGENGTSSANGIRVTLFDTYGVYKSLTPQETYSEFSKNGYLSIPEGIIAINIPMWNNSDDNEIYILNRLHTPQNGICLSCNKEI